MSAAPVFVGTPKTWQAVLSAANTNRDGTGTIVDVVSGGALGSRIHVVRLQASGTTTAGFVRLFLNDGTNTRLEREVAVAAATPSATIAAWADEVTFPDGLVIPNGWKLRASTHNAEGFNVFAHGGDI